MARRRLGLGGGTRTGGTGSGGTPYNPNQKVPSPKPAPVTPEYIMPPALSFDPSIEAQRRAAQRGLEDTEQNVATKEHFAQKDLSQALRDIKVKTGRGRQDINRSASRGQQKLGFEEQDLGTKGARANQDFDTSLANIARQFKDLGHRQAEGANAAGTLDAGTSAASAAARARNQGFAEAPVNTARQRTGEDLATALSRIGTSRGQLESDQSRSLGRLTSDRDRERLLSKRDTGRKLFEGTREEERARREAKISDIDLLTQEIYAARAEHPSVFKHWKQAHPDAVANVENPGGNSGGTSPPKRKRKGGR